jgi:uncharacterized protein
MGRLMNFSRFRIRVVRLSAAALCLLLLPGLTLAQGPAAPADAQSPPSILRQIDAAPNRGLLYEISDGKGVLYLFGTIHVGKPEFYPLNRRVVDAVRSSGFLAVEADVTDTAAMGKLIAEYAMYPAADSLDRHISSKLMQKLQPVLEKYKIPLESARRMKPWLVALALEYAGLADTGYNPQYGADLFLIGLAKALKKPIAEVESMEFQMHLFDSMTPAEQEDDLAGTVDELASGEYRALIAKLAEAWSHADTAALNMALDETEAALPPDSKALYAKLIKNRNGAMTERISTWLHSDSQYFVAVGTAHLLGDDGIVARLKAQGYQVRELR